MKSDKIYDTSKVRTDIYNSANQSTRVFLTQSNGKIKHLHSEIEKFCQKTAGKTAQSIQSWSTDHKEELPELLDQIKSTKTHEILIHTLEALPSQEEMKELEAGKKKGELSKEASETLSTYKKQRKKLESQLHREAWVQHLQRSINQEEIWLYFTLKVLESKEMRQITVEQLDLIKGLYSTTPNTIPTIGQLKSLLISEQPTVKKTGRVKKMVQAKSSKKSRSEENTETVLEAIAEPQTKKGTRKKAVKPKEIVPKKQPKTEKKKRVAKATKKETGTVYRVFIPAPLMGMLPSDCKKTTALPEDSGSSAVNLNNFGGDGEFQLVLCKKNLSFQEGEFVVQGYLLLEHLGEKRVLDKLTHQDKLVSYSIQGQGFQKGKSALIQRTVLHVQGEPGNLQYHRDEATYDGNFYSQPMNSWDYAWLEGVLRNDRKVAMDGALRVTSSGRITLVTQGESQELPSLASLFDREDEFYFVSATLDGGVVVAVTAYT